MLLNRPLFRYLARATSRNFDLLIATCGYEERSREVASRDIAFFESVRAYTYPTQRVHSYERNVEFFGSIGELRHPATTPDFCAMLASDLREAASSEAPLRVAVDISSFDRDRLGAVVRTLEDYGMESDAEVTFFYAVASFDSHSPSGESMVLVNGPLEGFEGWTSSPSLPVACIVGLGFENLVALAALETLEPARTVAFLAQSDDARFHERVLNDNAPLIRSDEVAVVPYDLDNPFGSLHSLEGVVHALRGDHRVALVPLGPKLFALFALLVAREYRDEVAVWRVSADQAGDIGDRAASGQVLELSLNIVRASPSPVPSSSR